MQKREMAARAARVIADLYEVAGRLRREGDSLARSVGQTQARWQVLSVISEGKWTVPRIAERLGVTRQNVQRIADDLQDAGLAELAPNGGHARSPFVLATVTGQRALGELRERATPLDLRIAGAIGDTEIDGFHTALRRLLTNLREDHYESLR